MTRRRRYSSGWTPPEVGKGHGLFVSSSYTTAVDDLGAPRHVESARLLIARRGYDGHLYVNINWDEELHSIGREVEIQFDLDGRSTWSEDWSLSGSRAGAFEFYDEADAFAEKLVVAHRQNYKAKLIVRVATKAGHNRMSMFALIGVEEALQVVFDAWRYSIINQ